MGKTYLRDENRLPIHCTDFFVTSKSVTFDATENANGDYDGTGNPSDLFTVTGLVAVRLFGFCTTNVAGASATIEVGTAKGTAGLIAQTTGTDLDANEIWHDASPDASIEALTVAPESIVGEDIILTVGTADATGGVVNFYALWRPLSADGELVAA